MKKKFLSGIVLTACLGAMICFGNAKAIAATVIEPTVVEEVTNDFAKAESTIAMDGVNDSITEISMKHSGVLNIDYSASGLAYNVDIHMYSDEACTLEVGSAAYMSSYTLTASREYTIQNPGKYYLKATYGYDNTGQPQTITMFAWAYNGDDKTLSSKPVYTYTNNNTKKVYHKLVVKKTGLATIKGNTFYSDYTGSLSLGLCNSKKVAMGQGIYLSSSNSYTEYVTLKKGTYYLTADTSYLYQLQGSTKAVANQGTASKAKATTIKAGKSATGLCTVNDGINKESWFKVKLTKKKKLSLTITGKTSEYSIGYLDIVPANSATRVYSSVFIKDGKNKYTSSNQLPKGTYYIKVTRYSISYNGSYSIKFNK